MAKKSLAKRPSSTALSSSSSLTVGVGASAGGLEACRELFRQLPKDADLCLILVVHLDPDHESVMAELLAKESALPVEQAHHGQPALPNRIYVVPPNVTLTLSRGLIFLAPLVKSVRHQRIDTFFESLAQDQGDRAVGIILTGMGSDGTLGLRAIKEAGGLTLVQDPEGAEHDGMPRSAMADGFVDHCMPVSEMSSLLVEYSKRLTKLGQRAPDCEQDIEAILSSVCHTLERELQHDFSQYKRSTMLRRVHRRMCILGVPTLQDYLSILQCEPQEPNKLLRELLISVTRFFRDPECFVALALVLDLLVRNSGDRGVRLWVPACAGGEEAYSLAILVSEAFQRAGKRVSAQIFSTEIDVAALSKARKGSYPEGIEADVSAERLHRFFTFRRGRYQVKSELRALCLFSEHNVISDAPFSRLDMVSCRNLLIYFDAELQQRIINTFHYSINPGGYMLLGAAESLGNQEELFRTVDKTNRIFKALQVVRERPATRFSHLVSRRPTRLPEAVNGPAGLDPRTNFVRFVLPQMGTTVVTIDRNNRIVDICGHPDRYFTLKSGQVDDNIIALARKELTSSLRMVIQRARNNNEPCRLLDVVPGASKTDRQLEILVFPYVAQPHAEAEYWVVVIQEKPGEAEPPGEVGDSSIPAGAVRQLESELEGAREHLRTVTADLETHIEELHSSNEEIVAMNEEFQSTNEELRVSKEELQSTNQELLALNCELQESAADRDQAHADLLNLFINNPVPTIFLDKDLRIRQFTASSTEVYRLLPTDAGRSIMDIAARFGDFDMKASCERVLRTLQPFSASVVRTEADRPSAIHKLRVLPYRTLGDQIDGVVLTFVDITETEAMHTKAEARARQVSGIAKIGLLASREGCLERFVEHALEEVCEVLSLEAASVHRLLPDSSELELLRGRGWKAEEQRIPLPESSPVRSGLAAGQSISFEDLEEISASDFSPLLAQRHLSSGILFAVLHDDSPYGVLGAYSKDKRVFSSDEKDFLSAMTALIGTALAHGQETFLQALEKVVTSTLSSSAELLESLARELQASLCELWLFDGEELTCRATNRNPQQDWPASDATGVAEVLRQKSPVWVIDLCFKNLFFSSDEATRQGLLSGFGVPLLSGGEPVGVLTCFFPVRLTSSRRLVESLRTAGSAIGEFLRRTEAERALEANEDRLYQALKSVPFPLSIILESGELLLVSDSTYEMTGLTKDSIATLQDWVDVALRDPGLTERILEAAYQTVEEPAVRQWGTHTVWSSAGEKRLWEFTAAPLGRAIDGKRMLTAVAFDITDRELARRALEESSAYKDEFLAMLGHELRNPLAGIRNGVQLLQMSPSAAEASEALGIVDRQSFQMTSLIDGLLDLSRIARGKVSLDPCPLDFAKLVAELVADRVATFTERGVNLFLEAPPSSVWVEGDRVRLQQVVDNLLGNGLKFTEPGGEVVVNIRGDGREVVMSVKDTGQGMTADLAAVVFEPFRQGPQTLSRSQGGLGLGLALVKLIVELHSGSVTVSSPGLLQGTEFRVVLPACEPGQEAVLQTPTALVGWNILIVEDNRDFGRSLERLLVRSGHRVRRALDGQSALAIARTEAPQVILCDIGLPEALDGFELLKRFRAEAGLASVPVIAMTGYGLAEDKQRSMEAGFEAHLNKPFDTDRLHQVLRELNASHKVSDTVADATPSSHKVGPRRVLVVDDHPMIASSLCKMLVKLGHDARFALSAKEAVAVARDLRPEVALLDLGLPDRSGLELLDDLRSLEECRGCIFYAMTGRGEPEDREKTRLAGFADHLVKPLSLPALGQLLDNLPILNP